MERERIEKEKEEELRRIQEEEKWDFIHLLIFIIAKFSDRFQSCSINYIHYFKYCIITFSLNASSLGTSLFIFMRIKYV